MTGHGELELHAGKAVEITPGIHQITNAEHHALRALSNSGMADLAVSPLRYWYLHINPAPKEEADESAALRMGSAMHCAVLESEETFMSRYACKLDPSDWPVCLDTMDDLRKWHLAATGVKAGGTRKDEVIAQCLNVPGCPPILAEEERRFFAQNEGKTILTKEEWERVAGMAQALAEEPALRPILREGRPEVTMVAKDPETGVLLKARLDWYAPKFTLDLKSFTAKRGASIDRAVTDAIYYERYWVMAYFYDYVRRLATGEGHGSFDTVLAFAESDQPHETRIRSLLPKSGGSLNLYWETARIEVRQMIRLYAECLNKYGEEPWRNEQKVSPLQDEEVKQFAFRSE